MRAASTLAPLSREEICTRFLPSSGLLIVWTSASWSPASRTTVRTWSTLTGRSSGAVIRVPPSKSMPKFRPLPAIAKAPISMIRPEAEKNHFEAPM